MDNLDEMEDMVMDETREASFEPHEGMEFPSRDATFDFYNAYGYIIGFSIRTQTKYKNVEGLITSIRLVCSKEGFTKKRKHQLEESLEMDNELVEKTPEKEISTKRCGCKASCQIRLHKDGIWRITGLFKDHNHPLVPNTPSKRRHLRSHKRISMEDRVDIELLHEQNVGATQIREYLVAKAGGKENLHFSKKDVNNHIASAKKIMNKALTARVAYDKTCRTLDELDEDLTEIIAEIAEERPTEQDAIAETRVEDSLKFKDPPVSQCKGTRKPNRFKPLAEIKAAKKMRTCSYCHKKEGHNMRACPKKRRDEIVSKGPELISLASDDEDDEDNSDYNSEEDMF